MREAAATAAVSKCSERYARVAKYDSAFLKNPAVTSTG